MSSMSVEAQQYTDIVACVEEHCQALGLVNDKTQGRPRALTVVETVSLGIFKQLNGIPTKVAVYRITEPECSYKTMVVNMNEWAWIALLMLCHFTIYNRCDSSLPIRYTDASEVPVCRNKNADKHKTMKDLASWGKSSKGYFYGLKLHLTVDRQGNILAFRLTTGSPHDSQSFAELNRGLTGLFITDAGYLGVPLTTRQRLFSSVRKDMKKLATKKQLALLGTRQCVEESFRQLKELHHLVTNFPRSVKGYIANYCYALLAYQMKKV
jgi:hypothetical protein